MFMRAHRYLLIVCLVILTTVSISYAKPKINDYDVFLEAEDADALDGFGIHASSRAAECSGSTQIS